MLRGPHSARVGYAFRKGEQGLGYYLDVAGGGSGGSTVAKQAVKHKLADAKMSKAQSKKKSRLSFNDDDDEEEEDS